MDNHMNEYNAMNKHGWVAPKELALPSIPADDVAKSMAMEIYNQSHAVQNDMIRIIIETVIKERRNQLEFISKQTQELDLSFTNVSNSITDLVEMLSAVSAA